ncbi:hypothetical protein SporoP37_13660 [Sporosarcina sp. P37]|uniref:YfjI family protein n=1 Tax=unclassified Sporosarcina TaxID=2647733 RepID=UPI000A17CA76|nr:MULTISPECIES: YfjI family protein [unclassified Sporosarcina]ARK25596.1 hypothetical protein SporoP37_13660 [Sporosarcina sp. P37]PID17312.1 DUF3987 domain-containing protein [Sporosarcina sp. P35]
MIQNNNIVALIEHNNEKIDEWEIPLPFNKQVLPTIEVEVFPEWIKDYIYGVAEETQTPVDASALASIAALSTALADKFVVSPKEGWIETINTYMVVSLSSANRKSAIFNRFISPISDFEKTEMERTKSTILKSKIKRKMEESRLATLEAQYAKKGDPEILEEATKIAEELAEEEEIIAPRYITSDSTPEKIADLMFQHNERMAILSSEGAEAFEMIAGRYSNKPNIDIYLKAYSADYTSIDRLNRPSIVLQKPRLTIGLFVQPSVIQELPIGFSNRGLTQRFLYALPASLLGYRHEDPKELDYRVSNLYYSNMQKMLGYNIVENSEENSNPLDKLKRITLDDEAYSYMLRLEKERELMLRNQDVSEGYLGWIGKLTGQIIRIAALFHIADNITKEIADIPLIINYETLQRANALRDYFLSHAEQAFGIMGNVENENILRYVLKRILDTSKGQDVILYRDLQQLVKRKFNKMQELREVLKKLEEMHYIRNEKVGLKEFIRINPTLLKRQG